jgi:hypothetical protein
VAIGAKWLALSVAPHPSCDDGEHADCGPTTYLFYNIATGKPRIPRLSPGMLVDLDSPTLTRRICRPLQIPEGDPTFPAPFMFYGRYALELPVTGIYLDRCGSRLHLPLLRGPYNVAMFGNSQAVGFCTRLAQVTTGAQQVMQGLYLPSLRRFQVIMPSDLGCPQGVALGPRHLAVIGGISLWMASFPSRPPSRS